MEKGFLTDSDNPHNSQNLLLLKVFCQSSLSLSSKSTSRLYKSLESGNGTKISDEKWRLVKLKYLENKKWWKGAVKSTRIMNAQRLQWCIMFLTDFWKKLRIYLWSSGILTFLWVLEPSWQHFGCRSLWQPSPVELYYRLIDLNQDSKVIQGVK